LVELSNKRVWGRDGNEDAVKGGGTAKNKILKEAKWVARQKGNTNGISGATRKAVGRDASGAWKANIQSRAEEF